jgi:prophage tail gpP-like protein
MTILPEDDELTILTGGLKLGGWTGIRVSRGVERLPSGFVCEMTEEFPGALKAIVMPGQPCEVYLSGDKVLTGYIDVYTASLGPEEHKVRILGRSKTEDLVDCSLDPQGGVDSWEFKAATLNEAAKRLAAPFGIEVSAPDGDLPLDQKNPFIIEPGKTVAAMLEEMARNAEALLWDDENGRLVISKVGTKRAGSPLVEGGNVAHAEVRLSMDQRFSRIKVLAQGGNDVIGPDEKFHWNNEQYAYDIGVKRYRPLVIVGDLPGEENKWSQQRALWEANRRFGRSQVIEVTVVGWRDGAGQLWLANTIVNVDCPTLKMQADLVIAHVSYVRGDLGTETILTCMPAAGLQPLPFHSLPSGWIPGAITGPDAPNSSNLTPGT